MNFNMTDTFSTRVTRLTGEEQRFIKGAASDLQMNPARAGRTPVEWLYASEGVPDESSGLTVFALNEDQVAAFDQGSPPAAANALNRGCAGRGPA